MKGLADIEKFFRDRFEGTPIYLVEVKETSFRKKDDSVRIEVNWKTLMHNLEWEPYGYGETCYEQRPSKVELEELHERILKAYLGIVKAELKEDESGQS